MSIIIGADFVPTERNELNFVSGNLIPILGSDLVDVLKSAGYRIVNLEMPLVNVPNPRKKSGPALIGKELCINGYKNVDIDLVTLANNHIMDQGTQGLFSTIEALDANSIAYVGAGQNLENASRPFIFSYGNKKIGVYSCVEHEFSIAKSEEPGANPYDPLESFNHVKTLKEICDYTIVLYHGGKEFYRYPSPMLQKTCRKFVESGANLVACQHSHCIGCEEKYLSGTIVYGQGNFLFDSCKGASTQTGLLIKINDSFSIEYIPLVKKGNGVNLADEQTAKQIVLDFMDRSSQIVEKGFVEKSYAEFAEKQLNEYLLACSGYNHKFLHRVVNRLTGYRFGKWYAKHIFKPKDLIVLQNYIECEAHRELFIQGLKNLNV